MHLMLARWRVELRVSPPALAEALAPRYAGFACAPSARADLVVDVQNDAPAVPGDGAETILLTALVDAGERYLLDGPQFYGMIHPSRGVAELHLRSLHPWREVEYFLRVALALFALQRDGLLLHCAALKRANGVCTDDGAGQVYLFVGQSGSGKSTVAALSQASGRAAALGDDLILLRPGPEGWCAYGTPFWNFESAVPEGEVQKGRVAGIYKLVQDRAIYTEPMGRAAAAAELLANSPIVNDQPALLPVLFDRCRAIAGAIGVRRLHFRKDDAFWDVIASEGPC